MEYNITLTSNSMTCDPAMNPVDLAQIFCGALIAGVQNIKYPEGIPEEEMAKIRRSMFDDLNLIFSRTLEIAFPELELRPEITEQAIMELENQMIDKEVAKGTILLVPEKDA